MSENTFDIFIEEKIKGDADFQATLTDLGDDDKTAAIENRRKELIVSEAPTWFEESTKNKKAYEDTKTRAEKAETELKKLKPKEEKKLDENNLSTKDFFALNKANISEDDIDDVIDYAKFKGISVADALNSNVVKATLADKAEARRTANATQTRQTRPQNASVDGASIIEKVKDIGNKNGNSEDALPEPGSKEALALFEARHKRQ